MDGKLPGSGKRGNFKEMSWLSVLAAFPCLSLGPYTSPNWLPALVEKSTPTPLAMFAAFSVQPPGRRVEYAV
jgi:hypothetical protein